MLIVLKGLNTHIYVSNARVLRSISAKNGDVDDDDGGDYDDDDDDECDDDDDYDNVDDIGFGVLRVETERCPRKPPHLLPGCRLIKHNAGTVAQGAVFPA